MMYERQGQGSPTCVRYSLQDELATNALLRSVCRLQDPLFEPTPVDHHHGSDGYGVHPAFLRWCSSRFLLETLRASLRTVVSLTGVCDSACACVDPARARQPEFAISRVLAATPLRPAALFTARWRVEARTAAAAAWQRIPSPRGRGGQALAGGAVMKSAGSSCLRQLWRRAPCAAAGPGTAPENSILRLSYHLLLDTSGSYSRADEQAEQITLYAYCPAHGRSGRSI